MRACGALSYSPSGEVWRRFDARDGLGIKLLQQQGLRLAVISGGRGVSIANLARDLGIAHCYTAVHNKQQVLMELQQQLGLEPRVTAFVGDDLNDLVVRPLVGLLVAPADACRAVRRQADLVLRRPGGHGAVRELAERILRAQGHWHGLARHGWRQRN
ncbi:MAG: HAD family hydrolase [Synechococcus sp.]|nr:HAD family hydrolase [Synechococcus sp.]